ncbi:glycosyltransferase family 4 protein [Anaerosporobacter faecicola]|uniref:glycosyltransferase family 4 protein n=1 Tax=Anaerosporobacter faecicola TaxID=2718714 RepID=UPI001EE5250A|nr:glycosyltransferase family 4 protein [Anaerosporobacter faecicola]
MGGSITGERADALQSKQNSLYYKYMTMVADGQFSVGEKSRVNIGIFTETYYPEINGVATSCFMLKTELEKMGHNVYVFTTKTPGEPEFEHNVFRVPSVPFIFLSDRRVGMFYQPRLATKIKKLELDVIHTNTEFSLGIFGRIMARELNIPVVHTYHTIYEDYSHYIMKIKRLDKRTKAAIRFFSRKCCNSASKVIVPTNKVKDLLLNYHVHSSIEVIPTGIKLDKFSKEQFTAEEIRNLRLEYGIKENEKSIVYLGRISQEKNIEELLRAMPAYMEKHADVKFVIVGGGPDQGRLKQIAKELCLEGRVIFAGEKPWDTIGRYYQLGDVFMSASQSETQGLTYIEAMAAGLPVVAKQDACLEDILIDGYNGYGFHNQQQMYAGLDAILYGVAKQDIEDRVVEKQVTIEQYSQHALEVVKTYSTETFARKVLHLYQEVVEEKPVEESLL